MSSSYSQLLKDRDLGYEQGELPVQEFLKKGFGVVVKNVGKEGYGWDLEFTRIDKGFIKKSKIKNIESYTKKFVSKFGKTFEIKRDRSSDRTNNIFLEVWSHCGVENAGCIQACTAQTIVFVRKEEFIFLNRAKFLSWIIENLFMRTLVSDKWRKTTFKRGKKQMMSSPISPFVRGILIPVVDIISCPACFHIEKRNI